MRRATSAVKCTGAGGMGATKSSRSRESAACRAASTACSVRHTESRSESRGECGCAGLVAAAAPVDPVAIRAEHHGGAGVYISGQGHLQRVADVVQREVGVEVELDDHPCIHDTLEGLVVYAVQAVPDAHGDAGLGEGLDGYPHILRKHRVLPCVDPDDEVWSVLLDESGDGSEVGNEGPGRGRLVAHEVDADDE